VSKICGYIKARVFTTSEIVRIPVKLPGQTMVIIFWISLYDTSCSCKKFEISPTVRILSFPTIENVVLNRHFFSSEKSHIYHCEETPSKNRYIKIKVICSFSPFKKSKKIWEAIPVRVQVSIIMKVYKK